jgi:hypothetical protein
MFFLLVVLNIGEDCQEAIFRPGESRVLYCTARFAYEIYHERTSLGEMKFFFYLYFTKRVCRLFVSAVITAAKSRQF